MIEPVGKTRKSLPPSPSLEIKTSAIPTPSFSSFSSAICLNGKTAIDFIFSAFEDELFCDPPALR